MYKDELRRSSFLRFLRNFVEGFNLIGAAPGTVFLKNLRRMSPVDLSHLLRTRTSRTILFDLRSRHESDCFPFTIGDALQVGELDWVALLDAVPSQNVVVLYGANDESVAEMMLPSLPDGCEVWTLRGGLEAWCESGLPVNDLHNQHACSEEDTR